MKQVYATVLILILLVSANGVFAANRYSICNGGNWNDPNCWSATPGGVPCGCVPSSADNIYIQTNMTLNIHLTGGNGISGLLSIASGASLYTTSYDMEIKNGGTLNVYGNLDVRDLTFANGSNVLIESGAVVNVHRNFSNNNNSNNVVVNGTLNIYGSAYNGNGGSISGSGSINPYGGPFTGGGSIAGPAVLPIELLSFTATATDNNGVELYWATATETNNDYFTVEKTRDGEFYEPVTIVDGAGTSASVREYNAIDPSPYPGISYYRLKQTDFDGGYSYSNLVAVDNTKGALAFEVFPNPAHEGEVYLSISASSEQEILVVVNDMLGREFYSKVVVVEDGRYKLLLDPAEKLAPGLYMVIASSHNNRLYSEKVIVK
jgi:hypothetical protein